MADTCHVFRVRGMTQSPVVHIHTGSLLGGLLDHIDEDVDRTLRVVLGFPVQQGDAQNHTESGVTDFF